MHLERRGNDSVEDGHQREAVIPGMFSMLGDLASNENYIDVLEKVGQEKGTVAL